MSKWYYLGADKKRMGPFGDAEIINLIKIGGCKADSMISRSGDDDWTPLEDIQELAAHIPIAQQGDEKLDSAQLPPVQMPKVRGGTAAYLYVPVSRLVILSIFSCGLYDIYWMYMNWRFLKKRDNLDILPSLRALFAVFFCHSLFNSIHDDSALSRSLTPAFYPTVLATLWVILVVISFLIVDIEGRVTEIISYLVPRFLCLVPIQMFINSGNREMKPLAPYTKMGIGDIICIAFGLFVWIDILLSLIRN